LGVAHCALIGTVNGGEHRAAPERNNVAKFLWRVLTTSNYLVRGQAAYSANIFHGFFVLANYDL
jgi:hypothetical protein